MGPLLHPFGRMGPSHQGGSAAHWRLNPPSEAQWSKLRQVGRWRQWSRCHPGFYTNLSGALCSFPTPYLELQTDRKVEDSTEFPCIPQPASPNHYAVQNHWAIRKLTWHNVISSTTGLIYGSPVLPLTPPLCHPEPTLHPTIRPPETPPS